jgi:hypothetical protein
MKNINIIALVSIASMMMACSSNDEVENNNEEKSNVTLSAILPATRTVFTDEGKTMKVEWAKQDKILVSGLNGYDATVFTSTNDANTNAAAFTGTLNNASSISTLCGVYPSTLTLSGYAETTVDYSTQKATIGYAQDNAMMTAKTTFNSTGQNMLNFSNETAILRITIKMSTAYGAPTTDNISSIVLAEPQSEGNSSNMINKENWSGLYGTWSGETHGNVELTFDTPVTLDASHPLVAYAIVLPQTIANGLVISARGEKYNYSFSTSTNITLEAGKMYRISKTATPMPLYYQWDAYAPYVNGNTSGSAAFGPNQENYNPSSNAATHSCKYCPTKDQILMYLGTNDLYYAKGTGIYANTYGLWIPKHENITGWDAGTATKIGMSDSESSNDVYPKMTQPTDMTKYFFLPACGCYENNDLIYKDVAGHYWSSTYYNEDRGYYLEFDKISDTEAYAGLRTAPRSFGHFIWTVQ